MAALKYLVITKRPNEEVGRIIQEKFGEDARNVADNAWIVFTGSSTSQALSESIFGDPDEQEGVPSHFVARIGPFHGYHDKDLWEWIEVKADENGS